MAMKNGKREDRHVRRIREKLMSDYASRHPRAQIDVKRYNSLCVHVRVLDPDFDRQSRTDRDTTLWNILDTLPEETREEITLLTLLTPEEAATSVMNRVFENRNASSL
jgi:hypothetical protein